MRLICPNCGAQYEVADDVIPTAGRDVQCSNCGHTWFEQPGASEAAEAGELLPALPPEPEHEPEPELPPQAEVTLVSSVADISLPPVPSAVPTPAEPPDDPVDPPDPVALAAAAGMPRRGLSADLAEMLREEAAREAAARAAEAPIRAPDPQSDSPSPDDPRSEEVRRRTARLRGEEPPAPPKPITPAARRELLPDIEKINSSLRPATEYGSMDTSAEPAVQARKRGARFGFSTVMLIVAILVGLYIGAPRLSILVPAAEPVLTRYVAVVNDVRLWIDLKMQAFIASQSDSANSPAAPEIPAPEIPTAPATEPATPTTDQTNG